MRKTKSIPPDQQVRLARAVRIVEALTGDTRHVATLHRWALRGINGVRLKTSRVGGYKSTSENWIREFFHEVALASCDSSVVDPKAVDRYREAEKALKQDGI